MTVFEGNDLGECVPIYVPSYFGKKQSKIDRTFQESFSMLTLDEFELKGTPTD